MNPSAEHLWSVLQGVNQGYPMIVRRNDSAPSLVRPDLWPIRIGVAIPLRAPQANGFPSAAENEELAPLEDRVAMAAGYRAILVLVITTSGMRELVLYAQTGDWIASFHAELMATIRTHEVQCIAEADPTWEVYRSFSS